MRRRRIGPEARPLRNIARSPRFAGYSTVGQGKISNDRFTGNVTYTDVTGAGDGPTLPDGTVLARYARLTVTTSRTRLGFHVADVIENATPTSTKDFDVTPGEQVLTGMLMRSSAAGTFNTFARGSNGSAWVDGASVSTGAVAVAANTWTWVWGVYTVPAGVTKMGAAAWSPTALANGVTVDCAVILVARSRVTLPPYGDGFFTDWRFTGTSNDSESVGWAYTVPPTVTSPWLTGISTLLPWAPPTLSSPVTINVDDTAATRHISLAAGQDAIIVMPNTAVTDIASVGTYESLITVNGGRNVKVIGGRITIARITPTTLTASMAASDTTATVASTTGYPSVGMLRIDGESMSYTGKTSTTFTGLTRNNGFYNSSAVSSNTTHANGANVYISERHRSAISFHGQTGIVHVEGLLIDGFVNDGIRFSGGTGTMRIQRCRIEGITNYDLNYETDGHPDGLQAYGGGAAEIACAQVSVVLGANGNGVINKGSDSAPSTPVGQWRFHDFEIITKDGTARSMFANSDGASSAFDVANAWLRYAPNQAVFFSSGTALRASFSETLYRDGQSDIVPAASVGVGYVSPGYTP